MATPVHSKQVITADLSSYIEGLIGRWDVPGLALAVVRPDGEVELGGYGVRDDKGSPVTPDTLFGIASCSKAFSTFAFAMIMQDYDTGKNKTVLPSSLKSFGFNTPVKKLYPDWQMQDDFASSRAQVMDLVAHVTGLGAHDLCYAPGDTAEEVVQKLRYIKPNRDLREEWQYNNLMYMANQTLVAKLSGKPYIEFIKDRIFTPLGMSSSTFSPSEAAATGRFSSAFCLVGGEKKTRRTEPHFYDDESIDLLAGAGGIISSVHEMTKWLKVLLAKGVNPQTGEALVPESTFNYMTAGHFVGSRLVNGSNPVYPEISATLYGAGWFRYSYRGHEIVYHTGGTPGISAYTVFLPHDGLGLCILTNLGGKHAAVLALIHRIVEDVFGLERVDWEGRYRVEERRVQEEEMNKKMAKNSQATPALALSAYCGTYKSPGYGKFTLFSSDPTVSGADPVLADFQAVDSSPSAPFPDDKQIPQLYASFPRIWSSHIRLRHRGDETWEGTFESLYPKGYGSDETPFVRAGLGPASVKFSVTGGAVKGVAFTGLYLPQRKRVDDEELSTVWFEKEG